MNKSFKVGDFIERVRTFSGEEVRSFANLSKDFNPIHLNEEIAKKSIFNNRIVHGMLYSSMFSEIIATDIPGPGSIYLEQNLRFLKPVFWRDELVARVEIIDILKSKSFYKLKTVIFKNENRNQLIVDGNALIKWQK